MLFRSRTHGHARATAGACATPCVALCVFRVALECWRTARGRGACAHDAVLGARLASATQAAIVTRDAETLLVRENESVYLPLGCVHRLENPGKIPLALIEVQSGAYLGEDDIVRIEDTYGRN